MNQNDQSFWKSTMTSGAILGGALVVYFILFLFIHIENLGLGTLSLIGLIPYIIVTIGIVWGTKRYRDLGQDGYITYGHALFSGTMIVMFASIVSSFFSYIHNLFIDPTYAERTMKIMLDKTVQLMQQMGTPEAQIEKQVQLLKSKGVPSPFESALSAIFTTTLIGFIISLVTAAILKKNKSIFADESTEPQP